jgi:hypothetical protein
MRSPRLVVFSAALLVAAATLGGSAVGSPAIACAEPNSGEWDIGAYDQCLKDGVANDVPNAWWIDHMRWCCERSGGVWNTGKEACQAPPAQPAGATPLPPQANLPPGIPTLAPVPANPPNVAPTLTRAPVSAG